MIAPKEVLFSKSPRQFTTISQKINYPFDLPTTPAAAISNGKNGHEFVDLKTKLNWFKRRTKRERRFLVAIFILSLLSLILFILTVVFAMKSGYDDSKVCRSNSCIASAAMLLQNMDSSADPCVDFYKFACGNFPLNHPIPDSDQSSDWFLDRKLSVKREIRDALMFKKSSPFEPLPVRQLRGLFSDCLDTDSLEQKGVQPLRNLLRKVELSLQPSLLDSGATAVPNPRFNWHRSAALGKRLAAVDLLFGVSIYPDPLNNSKNLLGIVPPNWQSPLHGNWKSNSLWASRKYYEKVESLHRPKRSITPQKQQVQQREVQLRQDYMKNIIENLMAAGISKGPEYGRVRTARYADLKLDPMPNPRSGTPEAQEVEDFAPVTYAVRQMYQFEGQLYAANNGSGADTDYQMLTIDALQDLTDRIMGPRSNITFDWRNYFQVLFEGTNVALTQADLMQVYMPYIVNLASILSQTQSTTIEALMWWLIVDASSVHLTRQLRQIKLAYVEDVTYGQTALSRSMFCAGLSNKMMGIAVSYLFTTPAYVRAAREKIGIMVEDIRSSFIERVNELDWMDDETRKATLSKVSAMKVNIAFPDFLLKEGGIEEYYGGLEFEEGQFFNNLLAVVQLQTRKMLASLPVINERDVWASDPTDVNAYHTFQANTITVPAGILQFPFFNLGMDLLDYGAIGSILGHEFTHGFDNIGRLYDEKGNFRPWWTNATLAEYEKRTACFVEQYGKFRIPELHANVNGMLTLSENIADNGGIRFSVRAYQKLRERSSGDLQERLPGLEFMSPEQLHHLSFTNLWCDQASFLAMKWSLNEAHAPNRARIWGTLGNSKHFSEVWQCPAHSAMNPSSKCDLW
ncbi:neprilysin-like isoform X2 [Neocloeon triangulifer]|uniref:neprilysin-like isoform X2 n=1 Tax=Neocloeon triangulifer TaxID=2078957 RepID=UPI00286EE645|nr:neprilysin-like isoform X2 [Neocloeon triangulifer]